MLPGRVRFTALHALWKGTRLRVTLRRRYTPLTRTLESSGDFLTDLSAVPLVFMKLFVP